MTARVKSIPKKPRASGTRLKGFTAKAVAKIRARRAKKKEEP